MLNDSNGTGGGSTVPRIPQHPDQDNQSVLVCGGGGGGLAVPREGFTPSSGSISGRVTSQKPNFEEQAPLPFTGGGILGGGYGIPVTGTIISPPRINRGICVDGPLKGGTVAIMDTPSFEYARRGQPEVSLYKFVSTLLPLDNGGTFCYWTCDGVTPQQIVESSDYINTTNTRKYS